VVGIIDALYIALPKLPMRPRKIANFFQLTLDDWMRVDAMYRSRALEFPGVGDAMVPCIDMANHASGDATAALYEVDGDGNAILLLRDGKQIPTNGEITIT